MKYFTRNENGDTTGVGYTPDGTLPPRAVQATDAQIASYLAANNVPTPAQIAARAAVQDASDDATVRAIAAMTPQQIVNHIDTVFAGMTVEQRRVLKVLAKMVQIFANDKIG